jgi:hypothetical protein
MVFVIVEVRQYLASTALEEWYLTGDVADGERDIDTPTNLFAKLRRRLALSCPAFDQPFSAQATVSNMWSSNRGKRCGIVWCDDECIPT